MSDIDTAAMESLKALDPNRPIREADIPLSIELTLRREGEQDLIRPTWNEFDGSDLTL